MSIASEITRINNNIASAYTAVNNKGGTLPATQNSANLPAAINSIPGGGGGGGDTVIAKATTGTTTYGLNDKVILKPTDDIQEELAGVYQFYAYPNETTNYETDCLTGFVTENKGTDILGNTTLEVSTVIDPTSPPWTNIGIVFGMTVTVNAGDI